MLILLYIFYGRFHDLRAELTISTEALWPTKLTIFMIRSFCIKFDDADLSNKLFLLIVAAPESILLSSAPSA